MTEIILNVTGMSCQHCEKAVVNALEDIGVAETVADAKNNTVKVLFDGSVISLDKIKAEIIEVGYAIS